MIAAAMSVALGISDVAAANVHITSGSTEAVSIGLQAASADPGAEVMLPLPGYFGFELSAMRWGVPITGYFRPDVPPGEWAGRGRPSSEFHGLAITVAPNGVSGSLPDPYSGGFPRTSLWLVDCIYCAHGVRPGLIAELSAHLRCYPLDSALWSFTVSKDLGIPGMRAGFLITRARLVEVAAAAHRLELTYVPPLIQTYLATLYALLLAAQRIRHDEHLSPGVAVERAWQLVASAAPTFAGFQAAPPIDALIETMKTLDALTAHCSANWCILTEWCDAMRATLAPSAGGYSALMQLPPGSATGQSSLVAWVNHIGRIHKLKVHPSVLYGGSIYWWRRLFGTEWFVRINLSSSRDHLRSCLDRLSRALAH